MGAKNADGHPRKQLPTWTNAVSESYVDYRPTPPALLQRLFPTAHKATFLDRLHATWVLNGRPSLARIHPLAIRLEARLRLVPSERPRYFTGEAISLELSIDEDCFVLLLHVDGAGTVRRKFPVVGDIGSIKAGRHLIPGRIEGQHEEPQKLVLLATKACFKWMRAIRGRLTSKQMQVLLAQLEECPGHNWSLDQFCYRVVSASEATIAALAESCLHEIRAPRQARGDMPACNAIARMALDRGLPDWRRRDAFEVFYGITQSLVLAWIRAAMPDAPRSCIEELGQEVYARFIKAPVMYQGYPQLLRYMHGIAIHVVHEQFKDVKRLMISRFRGLLKGLSRAESGSKIVDALSHCLAKNGLDSIDLMLIETLRYGARTTQLKTNGLLAQGFASSRARDFRKFIHNRRDTALWRALTIIRQVRGDMHTKVCDPLVSQLWDHLIVDVPNHATLHGDIVPRFAP